MGSRVLRPDSVVRQVARDWPETREVFEHYGLPVASPPHGPLLTLESFAKRQGINLDQLLDELARAAGARVDRSRNTIHRPFLASALFIGIVLGGGMGLWMAVDAAYQGGYEFVPARHALAHGMIQGWGFLVCFIVGIALRWLPPATNQTPVPGWRGGVLLALVGCGAFALFAWCHAEGWFPPLGPAGAAALLAAACVLGVEWGRFTQMLSRWETWGVAIVAGAAWLCVGAAVTLWWALHAPVAGPDAFDAYVRLLLADLPLVGFAVNCIYGFGLRILPPLVGAPVRTVYAAWAVALHNIAVFVLVVGRLLRFPATTAVVAALLLLAALLYVAAIPRLKRPRLPSDRPEQGPRISGYIIAFSFAWAAVGFLLYTTAGVSELIPPFPTRAAVRVYGPSLAPLSLYDAGRHAITLGFVTGLIIGVGSRLIPMLEHRLLQHPWTIAPAFLTLETGVLLRVGGDVLSLQWPRAWLFQAVAAPLVLIAMCLFALAALRTLWPPPDPLVRSGRVSERTPVHLLLQLYPESYDWLVQRGVRYLARVRHVPPELTLGSLIRSEGLDVESLLRELQDYLDEAHQVRAYNGTVAR